MSNLFDEDEEDLVDEDEFIGADGISELSVDKDSCLDARRRLENMLEEKRLRDELDDFIDY